LLHDLGKIGVPDTVLNKPGKLSSEEYELIKRHTIIGENILGNIRLLEHEIPALAQHHERLDGSGYPR
jgi:HD-GYP domain-containing protein (c-di-GMP phosphodiesterase class II)